MNTGHGVCNTSDKSSCTLEKNRDEVSQDELEVCGGLNKNTLHRLIELNVWSPASGASERILDETLLEEVCH